MSTTATHDTKRGEDVRARLHVISEMPELFLMELQRWENAVKEFVVESEGAETPDRNERYLIYQTILGIGQSNILAENRWPTTQMHSNHLKLESSSTLSKLSERRS